MVRKFLALHFPILALLSISCNPQDAGLSLDPNRLNAPILELRFPESSPASSETIEISVSSSLGSTIRIYSDESCSQEVASMVATDTSMVFSISLESAGTYHFYATQEILENVSSCTLLPLVYVYEVNVPEYMGSIESSSPQPTSGTGSQIDISLSGVTSGHSITLCFDPSCNDPIETIEATSDSVTFSVDLIDEGDYTFYAQSTNSVGSSGIVEVYSYSYGSIPSAPSSLTSAANGTLTTPVVTVNGVSIGDTVKIFSDSSCSVELGSAVSAGSSVDVTSSELIGFVVHEFFANSTNEYGTSSCSVSSASYELLDTPPIVSVLDFPSLRSSFIDCGVGQATIEDKILECSSVNEGAVVDVNGKIWKLLTKIGSSELWFDTTSGLVWSPEQGKKKWSSANSHCSGLSAYGISGVSWRLPTIQEMWAARSNGYANFGYSGLRYHWSSTYSSGSGYTQLWIYSWSNNGGDDYPTSSYDTQCVFENL